MEYEHTIKVASDPDGNCYLGIGKATWDGTTPVIKLGWLDRNGHKSRAGGEIWMEAYLQGLTELLRHGRILPEDALAAVIAGITHDREAA